MFPFESVTVLTAQHACDAGLDAAADDCCVETACGLDSEVTGSRLEILDTTQQKTLKPWTS
jgi:hypothetical protein